MRWRNSLGSLTVQKHLRRTKLCIAFAGDHLTISRIAHASECSNVRALAASGSTHTALETLMTRYRNMRRKTLLTSVLSANPKKQVSKLKYKTFLTLANINMTYMVRLWKNATPKRAIPWHLRLKWEQILMRSHSIYFTLLLIINLKTAQIFSIKAIEY